ncbi:phage baseplate assembly protein V [Dyella sp.]|uniref:phage baseplate assembly protein V n=1 Tax=Dyella sp. TaxID=1869338 RepID=UPI002B471196|nr:phage baseplate assembly protein V [Dyella sp.]HKT28761.1 phage baseplate assembly protein V [Dyella sp.]
MDALVELSRLLQNLLRYGVIASVDHAARRCTVQSGELVTKPLRWLTYRASDARTWWAPSVGEQVILLCPGGDTARGTVLPALYADDAPAPIEGDTTHITQYPDGALISYAPEQHELRVALPSGGKIILDAPAGINIAGNTRIAGALHVTDSITVDAGIKAADDVIAGTISLQHHKT